MKSFESLVNDCKKSLQHDPWTKERGLAGYAEEVKEETDEVLQAIENDDTENLKEELGDVLLDWIHTALLAEQEKGFTIKEIIENVNEKLNRRKPYISEERTVSKSQAKQIWQDAKKWEK